MFPSVSSATFRAYYSTERLRSYDILGPKVVFHFRVQHQHVRVRTTNDGGSEIILDQQTSFLRPQQGLDIHIEFPNLLFPLTMQNYIHNMLTYIQIPPFNIVGLKQELSTYAHQKALTCIERRSRFMGIVVDLTLQTKEYYHVGSATALEEPQAVISSSVPGASPQPAFIHAFEVTKFGDTENDQSSSSSSSTESCTICMDEFLRGVDIARLPCSHIFHTECILKWLENKNSCPLCRFVMPRQD